MPNLKDTALPSTEMVHNSRTGDIDKVVIRPDYPATAAGARSLRVTIDIPLDAIAGDPDPALLAVLVHENVASKLGIVSAMTITAERRPNGMPVNAWFVTLFEKLDKANGWDGPCGWFESLEQAEEALKKNIAPLTNRTYELAVIEMVPAGPNQTPIEISWWAYMRGEDTYGRLKEKPKAYINQKHFAL